MQVRARRGVVDAVVAEHRFRGAREEESSELLGGGVGRDRVDARRSTDGRQAARDCVHGMERGRESQRVVDAEGLVLRSKVLPSGRGVLCYMAGSRRCYLAGCARELTWALGGRRRRRGLGLG